MTPTPLLRVQNLHVNFGSTEVLHGIDLEIHAGERIAVVGQSGSGKSTVVAAILGLLPGKGRITSGSILLDTGNKDGGPAGANSVQDLASGGETVMRGIRGNRIALVPQDPSTNLNPSLKVGSQIANALRAHGMKDKAAITRRVVELMEEAGIPAAEKRAAQFPHEFSGGMRQRILIAIALAREPQLIIADEPTSALDVTVQAKILDHLQTLVDSRGMSLLLVTHDLGVAADRADRVIVMLDGNIVECGDPRDILRNPQHEYTRRLVDAAPTVDAGPALGTDDLPADAAPLRAGLPQPILEVTDVVKEYKLRGQRGQVLRAVDGATFTVGRGTTTAVVGESGSGKSTIARIVLGLEQPTSGTATIQGQTFSDKRTRKELRRRVQPVFQDPYASLNPTYTIEQLITEPLKIFRVGDKAAQRSRVAELLEHVALPRQIAQRRPGELSGGQRQRVAIARALALEPELIIADEAVSALDVLVQDQILKLLADLQTELGLSYLFITHDLAVVHQIAHQVVVMQRGRIVEQGPVEKIFRNPQDAYTRTLLEAIPGQSLAPAI